jgi:SAM-dependent methyltransferase
VPLQLDPITADPTPAEFVDWGGPTWKDQVGRGISWLGDLEGLRILELGTRYGGMATYFALRGARVTALDVTIETVPLALQRAEASGVAGRIDFLTYSGRQSDLPTGFDVVFAKSTLVMMGEPDALAGSIVASLVPGGRLLAIENARGTRAVRLLRAIRRRSWHPYGARYFTPEVLDALRPSLDVEVERWTTLPPTVLIGARAPSAR